MPPRFTNHQLYINGQKVREGEDYILIGPVENQTPAFKFLVGGSDKITLVLPQRDHSFVEVDLDPKKVHRLCDHCGENSMPQLDAVGVYYPEFPMSVCVPCTLKALRKEIASFRKVTEERRQQVKMYRRLFRMATRQEGTDFQAMMIALDAPKRLMDLVSSTDALVGRSKTRLSELKALVAELTEKPKRLVNILR